MLACSPDNGDDDVDPATKVLRVEFDRDMAPQGLSICGGGLELAGKPRWQTKRVFELPIKLAPNQKYELSINCPAAQNFRSAEGVPAEIYPLTFRTAAAGGKPRAALSLEEKRAAVERLKQAIDERYSYRDLRKVDWKARFDEFTPRLEQAGSWRKFATVAAALLSPARDPHITLQLADGELVGTFRRQVQPNFNFAQLRKRVGNLQLHGKLAATGELDGGIGYVLIAKWSGTPADFEPVFAALKKYADAPGLVLDVRPNAGGDELLARSVAGCFVRQPTVYSQSEYRSAQAPGGFTSPSPRAVSPNAERSPVHARTVVLMGPANMSSCESFLLMMREAPGVTLVGQRSYGSSGNPKPHALSAGLKVLLPSWRDLLPDGTLLEGLGVEPKVVVPATAADLKSGDPVLERGLELLRKPALPQ